MIWVYLSIVALSFASALVPLINIETFLVIAQSQEGGHTAALVVLATVGQMLGKVLWYWGATEVERAPWVRKQLDKPKARASLDKWHARAEGRPVFTALLLFLSAFGGIPPYAVTAILAGTLKVNFWTFLVTGLLGRGLRFWVIAAGAASVLHLW